MAQHDYVISDQDGASFLADLNNLLLAVVSQNSGASAPSTTYAYQLWADSASNKLKMRNSVNSAWVILGDLDAVNFGLISLDELRKNTGLVYTTSGTAPAFTVDASPDYPALVNDLSISVTFHAANAGVACTLALDGGATTTIFQQEESGSFINPTFPAGFKADLIYSSAISAWVIKNPFLGRHAVNQTLQNVAGSRVLGVTYTNTTSKPKSVSIRASITGAGEILRATVSGITIDGSMVGIANQSSYITFLVAPGESYVVNVSGGTGTISNWVERG